MKEIIKANTAITETGIKKINIKPIITYPLSLMHIMLYTPMILCPKGVIYIYHR